MTAIAALTLADGQATPVNHTFNPVNIDSAGVAKWADRVGGIALGFPVVSFSLRNPSKTNRNYKLTAKIVTPVLEVTSPSTSTGIQPAPTLAYNLTANIEMVLPERSTLAQRDDFRAYVKNFLGHAVITSACQNFESVY
jgi:hypothetical protein